MAMPNLRAALVHVTRISASYRAVAARSCRMFSSDNVTYSGGQEGVQGGFYGSGGARAKAGGK
jgi:hypothetical protein